MEVSMSKTKDTHTHTIFAELSHLRVGEYGHQKRATPIAELDAQNRDKFGVEWTRYLDGVGVGFLK